MPDELEERLKSHARAFDSLLSLIPAKLYYGEDVSDQWKRKKQTPEQKRAARMAKLDPDNWKSAKDVMDERAAAAAKRKREEIGETDYNAENSEKPKALQDQESRKTKKRKVEEGNAVTVPPPKESQEGGTAETAEQRQRRRAAQKAAKRERKQAKLLKTKQKKEKAKLKKKVAKSSTSLPRGQESQAHDVETNDGRDDDVAFADPIDLELVNAIARRPEPQAGSSCGDNEEDNDDDLAEEIEMDQATAEKIASGEANHSSSASSSNEEESPILSPQLHSGTSSISSIQPVPAQEQSISTNEKPPTLQNSPFIQPTNNDPATINDNTQSAKERLEARLAQLRADRKADDKPARNRQELLEQRRRKEEERKLAKKEQRRKEKEEEARKQDEDIARRFSPGGSGSLLASPRSPMMDTNNNFTFGRVAFSDGTQADADLSSLLEQRKQKGPRDPATALKAAQSKASRLSGLDEEKKDKISQQDMWLSAKKRAQGDKVRDDQSLLKKALKRKDSEKKKSGSEWQKREDGVRIGQEKRQQKRQDNLQKRRDEKGGKGKGKKVKRPGFEGSFKGRTGGGKKNKG